MNYTAIIIILFIINILVSLKSIYIMQLNSYNVDQQLLWQKHHLNDYIPNVILFLLTILWSFFNTNIFSIIIYMFIIIDLLVIIIEYLPRKQKKPLVFTKRIMRLFVLMIFIYIFLLIPYIVSKNTKTLCFYMMATAFSPFICLIAFLFMTPIEINIRRKFANEAAAILKSNKDIYTIGITGSFGKTSVKYFLSTILKSKYNVCFTKESYNTPMGATLTIKNELKSFDEIFVCEMGARRVGDINEMCELVEPKAGIITEVREQHLDTFKNIENVLNTKFELANNVLKLDEKLYPIYNKYKKVLLVNGDNELIKNHINEKYKEYIDKNNKTIYTFGFNNDNDYKVEIIDIDNKGTSFKFYDKKYDKTVDFKTSLLGQHNVLNLSAAIAMSLLLEVDINDIKYSIERITPVAHRLEIKKINDKLIVIDDAYNANIKGAKSALEVLEYCKNYTKIIITPGIVELGEKQYELNKEFIKEATKICDYIFTVSNANKKAFNDGIIESNFSKYSYLHFNSFDEAYAYANMNIKDENKVILIENDLTDNY